VFHLCIYIAISFLPVLLRRLVKYKIHFMNNEIYAVSPYKIVLGVKGLVVADEADAYMFYRCFFCFCFCFLFFPFATKIPDNRSREQLNGFS